VKRPPASYLALLIALILLVVAEPLLRQVFNGLLLFHVLLTFVFVTAFLAVFRTRAERLAGVLLGAPTLIGAWTGYILPGVRDLSVTAGFHLLAALFLCFSVAIVLRKVYREPEVSVDGIFGAFCGYLIVGVAFGHLYCMVEALAPGSFRGDKVAEQLAHADRRIFVLVYFSFMTLTTAGYGDIVPAGEAARGLAVAETVIGQFYLAVLVAELIGKRVSQSVSPPPSDSTK
jgi:hypothetical protein